MKRIAWLNDFLICGGSESTQKRLLDIAPYKIDFMTATNFQPGYDLYILNNFRTFTEEQIDYVITRDFIAYWHDVLYDDEKIVRKVAGNALFNIFLSPLHKDTFFEKYGFVPSDFCFIPPLFDENIPEIIDIGERKGVCWFGSIWSHKGIDNVLLWAKYNKTIVDFYGTGHNLLIEQLRQSRYADYKGHTDKSVMRKYKYFIHMPDEIEAFGRASFEAYLMDCHILHNNKIGAFSFSGWDYGDKEKTLCSCNEDGGKFWEKINDVTMTQIGLYALCEERYWHVKKYQSLF